MKQQVDPRLIIGIVAVLVVLLGFAAWRGLSSGASGSAPVSAAQAGLGKPMPNGPGQNPGPAPAATK